MFANLLRWTNAHKQYILFVLLLLAYSIHTTEYVWQSTIWSPKDEINHYDYIHRVAHQLERPYATDYIDRALFDYTQKWLHLGAPPGNDRSIEAYGFTAKSYEAHQPPVYYVVMAFFEKTLSVLPIDWITRIRLLREISVAFMLIGLIFSYKTLSLIRNHTQAFSLLFQHVIIILTFITLIAEKYGLTNDHFSFPVVSLSCYALVRWMYGHSSKWLTIAILGGVLSVLVKFTNLLYLAGLLIFLLSMLGHKISTKQFLLNLWPILMLPAYLLYNRVVSGGDALNIDSTLSMFGVLQPNLFPTSVYYTVMMQDWLNFTAYGFTQWKAAVWIGSLGLFVSGIYLVVHYEQILTRNALFSIALLFTLAILCAGAYLNSHVGGVLWFSMRLYTGYFLFFNLALLAPLSSNTLWAHRVLQLLLVSLGIPLLYDLIL